MSRQFFVCYILMMLFGILACTVVWRADHLPDIIRYVVCLSYVVGLLSPLMPDKLFEMRKGEKRRKNNAYVARRVGF